MAVMAAFQAGIRAGVPSYFRPFCPNLNFRLSSFRNWKPGTDGRGGRKDPCPIRCLLFMCDPLYGAACVINFRKELQ